MNEKEVVEKKFNQVIDLSSQDRASYFIVSYAKLETGDKPYIPRIIRMDSHILNKSTIDKILKVVGGDVMVSISFLGFMTDSEFNN